MSKITDTVSWCMEEEKIVKLEKLNKTFDLDEKVVAILIKKGISDKLEDKKVEVEIDESQGENGIITFLKVVEETKTETKKVKKDTTTDNAETTNLITKEITVGGVSVEKAGVVDKDTKIWFTLDSTINAQKFKDECTKKTVQITVAPQEKGNDVIKSYVLKEEEQKETKEEGKSKNSYSNNKDDFYRIKELERNVRFLKEEKSQSFEAQASVNSANQAVSGMVSIHDDPEKVLRTIEKIAEKNYEIIQKLKTKKE